MSYGNPARGPRIVPFGSARTANDRLANGRPSFRVTQRFADTDAFFGGKHNAIDIGNYYCGDEILAMNPGRVTTRKDTYGALIVEIDHGNGEVSGYGHLGSFAVSSGATVARGQVIGYVGDTGLGGVCHCHVTIRRNGTPVDPWPLLDQNIVYYRALKGYPTNVRIGPGTNYAIYATSRADGIYRGTTRLLSPYNARMRYGGSVRGTDGATWDKVWLGSAYRYIRSDLVNRS